MKRKSLGKEIKDVQRKRTETERGVRNPGSIASSVFFPYQPCSWQPGLKCSCSGHEEFYSKEASHVVSRPKRQCSHQSRINLGTVTASTEKETCKEFWERSVKCNPPKEVSAAQRHMLLYIYIINITKSRQCRKSPPQK